MQRPKNLEHAKITGLPYWNIDDDLLPDAPIQAPAYPEAQPKPGMSISPVWLALALVADVALLATIAAVIMRALQ